MVKWCQMDVMVVECAPDCREYLEHVEDCLFSASSFVKSLLSVIQFGSRAREWWVVIFCLTDRIIRIMS